MINHLVNLGLKFSFRIARVLVALKIKPMTVTISRFILAAPLSLYFFSRGEYIYNVVGLVTYSALAILDWVDGDLAKLYKLPKATAPFGRFIDHTLDRILVLIVIGAIFYAGINSSYSYIWTLVTIIYYTGFFFVTVLLHEFDLMFNLTFDRYPQLYTNMLKINPKLSFSDRMLYNFLYVHHSSLSHICFTQIYVLFFGILTNQVLATFIFISSMFVVRSAGISLIMYLELNLGKTNSALIKVLRTHKAAI